jgi:cobalt-zinc-cadmium efflux system protein
MCRGHEHHHLHHSNIRTPACSAPASTSRPFAIGIALQAAFLVAETVAGAMSHSLAVLADAGHNLSDVIALALAWCAAHLGTRKPTKGRTYGFKSASILASVANALFLVLANALLVHAALGRLRTPEPVVTTAVIGVASLGVLVNGFTAWLFSRGRHQDLNVRAAFVHLTADAAIAGAVAVTGIAIRLTGHAWLDPAASIVVSGIVLFGAWSLLQNAIDLAMHAVPKGLDEDRVRAHLAALPDVVDVHALRVWAISTTETALSAHLVLRAMPSDARVCSVDAQVRAAFAIHHVTLQIEPEASSCTLADAAA